MASRIQFQNPLAHYTPLSQRTEAKQREKQERETLLAAHPIETQLLGATPRWVRRITPYAAFASMAVSFAFLCYCVYQLFLIGTELRIGLILAAAGCLALNCGLFRWGSSHLQRMSNLLRHGQAVPALITEVTNEQDATILRILYSVAPGPLQETSIKLSAWELSQHGLAINRTFTLLVSPEDVEEVLPYFRTQSAFEVLPETVSHVSQEVSERLRAQAATLPKASAYLGAIEPELTTAIPRQVRLSSQSTSILRWMMGFVSLFLCLGATFWTQIIDSSPLLGVSFFLICCLYWMGSAVQETIVKQYFLLKNGFASRAVIVNSSITGVTKNWAEENQTLDFTYQYETGEGKVKTNTFVLSRKRAWHLGIVHGTTFTLLQDPKDPNRSMPYFELRDVEIAGAMGAKISPP